MKDHIQSIIALSILILLALTPIFNFKEVYAFISGNHRYFYTEGFVKSLTPFYSKAIKDLGFIVLAALALLNMKNLPQDKRRVAILLAVPIAIFIAVPFMLSVGKDPVLVLAGLRWAFPFFLTSILIGNVDDVLIHKIAKFIAVIFIFSVSLQIYEQCLAREFAQAYKAIYNIRPWPSWYLNFFKLSNQSMLGPMRAGGIFMMPDTAGVFACVSGFFTYLYLGKSLIRTLSLWLVPVSIMLTGSAMAMIVFFVSAYLLLNKKGFIALRAKYLFLLLFLFIIIALPTLTGRAGLFNSPLRRINFFTETLRCAQLVSTRFGLGTNSAAAFAERAHAEVPHRLEATPTLILSNIGLIGFVLTILIFGWWVISVARSGKQEAIIFTVIFSLFSLSLSITEAFPMNLLFAVGFAYFMPQIFAQSK